MGKEEITWSLMHPTQLDVEYMKEVVAKSSSYRVDSFEICAACHSNLGGLDGLSDYKEYPETHRRIDLDGVNANRKKLNEILAIAHGAGKQVYYWHREAMVPDGLLTDRPALLDSNGEFDIFGKEYEELLRYKISSAFEAVPELDGVVLTLTEASYSVIHNSNTEKFPPRKVVEHLVGIFAKSLRAIGRKLIVRSFGSVASDYEDILAGSAAAAEKYDFEVETKITPYDFDPFLPVNPFLRKLPGAKLGAECDALGEFLGAGMLPAENVENIVEYVRSGRAAGVDRYAIRLDRHRKKIFDLYEINLYAYARAIDDPTVTAADIRREWLEKHAPPSARDAFAELGKMGFELVKKVMFIHGNVIFHSSTRTAAIKILKAAYLFGLFKNEIPLSNGAGIWSVLSDMKSPGRDAIIREKEQACEIAGRGIAILNALQVEPGWEKEYAWRKNVWENGRIAAGAFLQLCKVIAAAFDDIEGGDDSGKKLNKAVKDAHAALSGAAGCDLAENPPDDKLSPAAINYLKSFYRIINLVADEFKIECAMRKKYLPGSVDGIIFGSMTDDWRIYRYMHASHAGISDGEFFRFAGNTVFPNGFIDFEIKTAGAENLTFYGDISETQKFRIAFDGKETVDASFDNSGIAVFPTGGADKLRVRLTKAEGSLYPRFRAVISR